MRIERTKNATRNIIWGVIEKVVGLLLPFITRTVLIKVLGAEYLGLNSLFTSILQVLSISELGIGSAIVFSMYKPIADNDEDTLCALLNFYRKLYYIIGTIILVAGLICMPFLPHLISGSYPNDINIYILYLIYLFNTVISYYLFAYKQAIFNAFQRNDLISKRASIVSLISEICKIVALLTIRSYYAFVVFVPIATVITNLLNAYLAKKMFPDITCRGKVSNEMLGGIKKRIIGLVSYKIYGVVLTSVDTIVISAFLGLTQLAIYNNYYYVQNAVAGFLTIITASITAGIGNKMVTDSPEANYEDFKNFVFANGWIVSWCSICMFCLYQHFMTLWVGEELTSAFDTMVLMVLYFFVPRITTMTYTYREAAGLWWEDRIRPIIAAVSNLVINLILVQFIGINGVLISTLVCQVFINIPWGSIILFRNYFKRSPIEYFGKLTFYFFATAVAGVITLVICNLFPSVGFWAMMGKALICVIVPNLVLLLIYHRMKEFAYTKSLAKRAVHMLMKK